MQRVGAAAGQRGCSLSKENTPFGTPRERQGGFPLDPAHWQFVARRAAQPADCTAVGSFAANGCATADDRSKSNRIATPTAATPRTGRCNRQALQLFELLACNGKRLSFGRATPVFFLGKENGGRITRHLCRIDIRTCAKKEEFSFEKENIPLSRIPCTVQGKNPSPLKGYHLLPVNKKSAPRFSKTARNIRFANPSPHA